MQPPPDFIAHYPEWTMRSLRLMPKMVSRLNIAVLAAGCAIIVLQCRLQLGLAVMFPITSRIFGGFDA